MPEWVDFAAIKRSVGLGPVLQRYHVVLRHSGRDQYRGRCPLHSGEGSEAFHANLVGNLFHRFSCGAGGTVLDFVAAIEGCTVRQAALRLKHDLTLTPPAAPPVAIARERVTKKMNSVAPLGFTLRGIDNAHPYLAARGIEPRTAREFGVGFYGGPGLLHDRVVIPIHSARGELVAYAGRALERTEPRYRSPPGFPKSAILFNLHRARAAAQPTVVVVEGFFDCLKLHQAGARSVVALMGSVLYPAQRSALQLFPRVILMLDGDTAGQRGSVAATAQLSPRCHVDVVSLPASAQPDQLSAEAIRKILEVHHYATVTCNSRMP